MRNPYKTTTPPALKRVSGDVSEADWKFLRQLVPDQGLQDILLSNLFHKFFKELKQLNLQIPTNESEFAAIKNKLWELIR